MRLQGIWVNPMSLAAFHLYYIPELYKLRPILLSNIATYDVMREVL